MSHRSIILIIALVFSCCWALAAEPAKLPAAPEKQPAAANPANPPAVKAKPASGSGEKVKVISVSGVVAKIVDGKRTPLQAGEQLDELTIICTGLRSKAVLKFADRGEVTVNSATKMGIAEFRKRGNLARTRLGLKYGSMRATIDSSAGPNDAEISTPVATLSVRGTGGDIGYTVDRGLGLRGRSGTWRVRVGKRKKDVSGGEQTDSSLTLSALLLMQQQTNLLGDLFGGLTNKELNTLTQNRPSRNPFNVGSGSSSQGDLPPTFTDPTKPSDEPSGDHVIIGI